LENHGFGGFGTKVEQNRSKVAAQGVLPSKKKGLKLALQRC